MRKFCCMYRELARKMEGGTKEVNKYRNKKIVIDGIKFDSITEGNRYRELKLLERAGKITDLELQPLFVLQDKFKKNNVSYRAITYRADFKYEENGEIIVEDVKGFETKEFKIKRKLFEYKFKDLTLKLVK